MVPLLAQLGIALAPSIFKGVSGLIQGNQANKINPVDPGFQMNNDVIDNARRLSERSTNYLMPGYGRAMNDINTTYSGSFNQGMQGATSGGDVLDLATKIAYGQAKAQNDLNVRNAQGAENMFLRSLEANAARGQEYKDKNAYDREMYQQQLREKAALRQASMNNLYGAINEGATGALSYLGNMGTANAANSRVPFNIDDYKSGLLQRYNSPYGKAITS